MKMTNQSEQRQNSRLKKARKKEIERQAHIIDAKTRRQHQNQDWPINLDITPLPESSTSNIDIPDLYPMRVPTKWVT
jgi:hypothetical protein